ADQKTVLTAIILRFLQQSVSEEGDGLRLRTLLSFSNFELNLLALFERAVAVHLDCAPVNEHVLVFAFEGDESVALFSVEPLDDTLCHYFSIQCSAIEIPHLRRYQTTASGLRTLVKLIRLHAFSHCLRENNLGDGRTELTVLCLSSWLQLYRRRAPHFGPHRTVIDSITLAYRPVDSGN